MSSKYQIPLSSGQKSFFVSLGDVRVKMTFVYRSTTCGGAWYMDIDKTSSGGVRGIPLILGIDLLAQYTASGLGSMWVERTDGKSTRPTFEDMGANIALYWSESYGDSVDS